MNGVRPMNNGSPPASRRFGAWVLRLAVTAALLAYIIYRFHFGQILSNMWHADRILLAAAVLLFIGSGMLGALQWGTLLRFHGVALRFGGTAARYFMGLFFNFILPGFVGGDVIRVYKTAAASGMGARSFASTLADRVLGLLVLVLFSIGAFAVLPKGPADDALPAAAVMFSVLAGFIALFAVRRLGESIGRVFGRFAPGGIGAKIAAVYDELHLLTRSPGTLGKVFALSCAIQMTRIGVHYLCARAVGIDLGFAYFALFVPVMEIVAGLPFSFGGVGVREMMGVTLFSLMGVPRETVISYTLLAYTAGFTGSLPGAVAFALSFGKGKKQVHR